MQHPASPTRYLMDEISLAVHHFAYLSVREGTANCIANLPTVRARVRPRGRGVKKATGFMTQCVQPLVGCSCGGTLTRFLQGRTCRHRHKLGTPCDTPFQVSHNCTSPSRPVRAAEPLLGGGHP